jgi:archaellum biogenesis protein FlaJ (TadC family)
MPFRWLCLTMHGAVVLILVFITEVIVAFGGMIGQAQETTPTVAGAPSISALSSFNLTGLDMMHNLVVPLVLVFTIANAITPSLADGGSKYKILSNLGLTAAISGLALLALPVLAESLFESVSRF